MNRHRFVNLTRGLVAVGSRRHLLHGAFAIASGVVLFRRSTLAQEGSAEQQAAATAVDLSELEATGAFDALYNRLHPDAQAIIPREAVVGWYATDFAPLGPGAATVTGVTVIDWTWGVTGQTYSNTAEVAYEQPFADGSVVEDVVRLVESDGEWRWFFGRSREFVDGQIARFGGSTESSSAEGLSRDEPIPITIELTVAGTPPEGATFLARIAPLTAGALDIPLTDPDGDRIYTAQLDYGLEEKWQIQIIQGFGLYPDAPEPIAIGPITIIRDFGVMTITESTTLMASVSFDSEPWQQVTWEGLTINYPPGHGFYPDDEDLPSGIRAAAALYPDDCVGTGGDCETLVFFLHRNDTGLSAQAWAEQNNWIPADASNLREVTVAGQPGIAFVEGDPNAYPGESNVFIAPVGKEILRISEGGYGDEVEQIVASITVSAPVGDPVLVEAIDETMDTALAGLEDILDIANRSREAGEYFAETIPSDQAELIIEGISTVAGLAVNQAVSSAWTHLARPGLTPGVAEPLIERAIGSGSQRTAFFLSSSIAWAPIDTARTTTNLGLSHAATLLLELSGEISLEGVLMLAADDARPAVRERMERLFVSGGGHSFVYSATRETVRGFRQMLEDARDEPLERPSSGSPDLVATYVEHLKRIRMANLVLRDVLTWQVEPLFVALKARRADDESWADDFALGFGKTIAIYGVSLINPAAGRLVAGVVGIAEFIDNTRRLADDHRMSALGYHGIWGALSVASTIMLNALNGVTLVTNHLDSPTPPQIPRGEFGVTNRISEDEAFSNVLITNTGNIKATFSVVASYEQNQGVLRPELAKYMILGDIPVSIVPGKQKGVIVRFMELGEGVTPEKDVQVVYEVLAATETWLYLVAQRFVQWTIE